jgi:CRISPR-associated protein Csh1
MESKNFITDIIKEEYKNFFVNHHSVYEKNIYRQGLFLLGTVVSKIKYAQKGKSSNILSKLNYEALSARRVPSFFNKIKEFSTIYKKDIFEEKGIWGNIIDRLQGIEGSGMKSDEVIFYILSGMSFEDYLGIKRGIEKKKIEGEKSE